MKFEELVAKQIKVREELLEKHYDKVDRYKRRDLYERTENRRNIIKEARIVLGRLLRILHQNAPFRTGYGRAVGIRYIKIDKISFTLIIGSDDGTVSNGEIIQAPYMAIQNVEKYYDWIDNSIAEALGPFGTYIDVEYGDLEIISTYPSGAPAGYALDVIFTGRGGE